MAKSVGVIIARVVVVLILLAGIAALIYFLVIRGGDSRGNTYEEMVRVLTSENQATFEQNIGGLESGDYYTYANTDAGNINYKNVYLAYYMDSQILDAYKDLIVYVGDVDGEVISNLDNLISNYETTLAEVVHSQELFNTTHALLGNGGQDNELYAEVSRNFGFFLNDFIRLQDIFHSIVSQTFNYVTSHYYQNVNPFISQKYAQSYALNIQSGLVNTALDSESGVGNTLYQDSIAMARFYVECKQTNFTEQSNSGLNLDEFISLVSNMSYDFTEFYNAVDKSSYFNSANDELKAQLRIVAAGLGLSGRL